MIILVFGFHRPRDFAGAGTPPGIAAEGLAGDCDPAADRVALVKSIFLNPTRPVAKAINVVFTRIVNDCSTDHGTTAAGPETGRAHEPVNHGS
jgi:hypothetical protein